MALLSPPVEAAAQAFWRSFDPVEAHGFLEMRGGMRVMDDRYQEDQSVAEVRLQGELSTCNDWLECKYKGDLWADGVTDRIEYETREAWAFFRPLDFVDVKLGRQVLTWGTGNLVFLNDLFPKDWQSFFIGRDAEYLKAPSDAVKLSLFADLFNIDLIYTPRFDADRYVTGRYVSYWDSTLGRRAGRGAAMATDRPAAWWRDDEIAVRLYRNIAGWEYAVYAYRGFWKRPAGQTASGENRFPALDVYGASVRGAITGGIGNAEIAWYRSREDQNGTDPAVRNSEMRYLVGYARELGRDLTASLQYYVEHMLHYARYRAGVSGSEARDRFRHVVTLEGTQLLMNQNLELSLSAYLSPSDRDAYLRPLARYKYTDHLTLSVGANIFFGDCRRTFFAQFEKNTNVYLAARYSF
jgi:hypothetical protein